jgi:hypothetical protein
VTNRFPQVLQWLPDQETPLCCDVLRRWPTLNAAQPARRAPRETCCRAHQVRPAAVIDPRSHAINAAAPLAIAEGVIAPHALRIQALVGPLRVT